MSAAALYDGLRAIPHYGTAAIQDGHLVFETNTAHESIRLPLKKVRTFGMLDQELHIEFSPPKRRRVGAKVVVAEPRFKKDLLRGFNACSPTTAFKHRIWNRLPLPFWLLLTALLFPLGYFAYTKGAARLHTFIPVKAEVALGEHYYQIFGTLLTVADDPDMTANLQHIVDELADPDSPYDLQVTIYKHNEPNAFAFPGGHIGVTTALLAGEGHADMVAGVLAHEVVHVEQRHSMQQLLQDAGVKVFTRVIIGSGFEEFQGSLDAIESGTEIVALKYSRDQEREADQLGMEKLLAHNRNPHGFIQFFNNLSKEIPEDLQTIEKATSWLSTHPRSEDRVEELKDSLEEKSSGNRFTPWALPHPWRKF